MCAKLRTVAATNKEIMRRNLSYCCLHYIYHGVILHTHPVRVESHNQRSTTGEIATLNAEVCLQTTLTHFLSLLC